MNCPKGYRGKIMCQILEDYGKKCKEEERQRVILNMINQQYTKEQILKIGFSEDEYNKAEKGNSERELAPLAGGLVSMSDDFDETPECFKEYM
jgi:hypothetical protein